MTLYDRSPEDQRNKAEIIIRRLERQGSPEKDPSSCPEPAPDGPLYMGMRANCLVRINRPGFLSMLNHLTY